MTSEIVPLLKHTPSAQDPRVLEAITVQREDLISALVASALDHGGGLRHRLLIGPRGMGKTHVLTLVASRVAADPSSDSVVIAWLTEDPWAIRTYDKFLAAILGQVADALDDGSLRELSESMRSSGGGEHLAGEEALRAALGDRRLVLLAENLDEVFRRIGPEGQSRFRAFIENWRRLLILATAPQLFDGVQKHESPFYGFFGITYLDELTLASATELLRRVAELNENSELRTFLDTNTAAHRLATVEALAGGHPRIWLLLAGCISIAAIDELVPLFLEALDELTPYYQDRLRELSDQQQEIVVLLAEAGGALSNRDLAARSGILQNQIASMLRQLTDRGYIRSARIDDEVATGDQRMSFWELREPLMRLCLDVKAARGKPLKMLVDFLRAWYGPRLLDELVRLPADAELAASYAGEAFRLLEAGSITADELLEGSADEIIARAERALAETPDRTYLEMAKATGLFMAKRFAEARDSLAPALRRGEDAEDPELRILVGLIDEGLGDRDAFANATDDLLSGPDAEGNVELLIMIGNAHELRGCTKEALAVYDEAIEANASGTFALQSSARLLSRESRFEEALEKYTAAFDRTPDDAELLDALGATLHQLGRGEESVAMLERAVTVDPRNPYLLARYSGFLAEVERLDDAMEAARQAISLAPQVPDYLGLLGFLLARSKRFEDALGPLRQAVEMDPEHLNSLFNLAHTFRELGNPEETIVFLRRAVDAAPSDARLRRDLAVELDRVGRYEEALEHAERASRLAPQDGIIQGNLGFAYRRLSRMEESLAPQQRAVELSPEEPWVFLGLALTLWGLERDQEALDAILRVNELAPEDPSHIRSLGVGLERLDRIEESAEQYARAIDLEPANVLFSLDYARALRRLDRYEEALAALAPLQVEDPDLDESRGFTLSLLGRAEEALRHLDRTIEAKDSHAPMHNSRANALRELGRHHEAETAARRAIELEDEDATYRFTLAEILLDRGDDDLGIQALDAALATWQKGEPEPPGETDLLCRILWKRSGEGTTAELIAKIVRAYEEAGAGTELGSGLVATIPSILDRAVGQARSDDWVAAWSATDVADLEIPVAMLSAATAWKRDRDRAHLLALPNEQRKIVIEMLSGTTEA